MNKETIKETVEKTKTNFKLKVGTASAALAVPFIAVAASAEGETMTVPSIANSISSSSFNGILQQMIDLLPIVLPVVVACLAFRKGISFLKSMIRGA